MAKHYMARERDGHTLQTTALINEVYLRLVKVKEVEWQDRAHFFAVSAQLMRRILTDFARSHGYQKRGAGAQQVPLDEACRRRRIRASTWWRWSMRSPGWVRPMREKAKSWSCVFSAG